MMWLKFYKVISKVQTRVKQYLARRAIRYAILNNRWNNIERKYFRKSIKNTTDNEGNYKPMVPYDIRKLYFREYLRYYRIEHTRDLNTWKVDWENAKTNHVRKLAEINAFSVLTEKPVVREEFELPNKPIEAKTLISNEVNLIKLIFI